jgi:predicted alpha/beta-fold hydrolase
MGGVSWILQLAWDTWTHTPERFAHRQPVITEDGHTCSIWWDVESPFMNAQNNNKLKDNNHHCDEKKMSDEDQVIDIVLISPGFYDNWKGGYVKQCLDALRRYSEHRPHLKMFRGVFHKPFVVDPVTANSVPTYTEPRHLIHTLKLLATSFPKARIFLIGCSAGGNLAMRAAHEAIKIPDCAKHLTGVASVCSPLDFHRQHREMYGLHWVYTRALWLSMLERVLLRITVYNPKQWARIFFFFLFCRNYGDMARVLHNYLWGQQHGDFCDQQNAIHFLRHQSSDDHLKRMVIYAIDDPMVSSLPNLSPDVERLALTSGGHLGFQSWQWDMIISKWLSSLHSKSEAKV